MAKASDCKGCCCCGCEGADHDAHHTQAGWLLLMWLLMWLQAIGSSGLNLAYQSVNQQFGCVNSLTVTMC